MGKVWHTVICLHCLLNTYYVSGTILGLSIHYL